MQEIKVAGDLAATERLGIRLCSERTCCKRRGERGDGEGLIHLHLGSEDGVHEGVVEFMIFAIAKIFHSNLWLLC